MTPRRVPRRPGGAFRADPAARSAPERSAPERSAPERDGTCPARLPARSAPGPG